MTTPVGTAPAVTVPLGSVEQLIEDEHTAIRGHLSHLRGLARDLPTLDEITARQRVGAVLDFLSGGLLPHAAAEEAAYVPLLAQLDPAAYTALHASIAAHAGDQGHAH